MVQKPIPNARFVDISLFRVVDPKSVIRPMPIRSLGEFAVEREYIIRQMKRKILYILALSLAT